MSLDSSALAAKTVLLADLDERTCESRAKILRTFGVVVDCATSAASALALFHAGVYSLVLIDLGTGSESERLAQEIRSVKRKQRIGFLVGSPLFVAGSPRAQPRKTAPAVLPQNEVRSLPAPLDFGQRVRQAEAAQKRNGSKGK